MGNTLTGLIPSLYAGLNTISRELTGYIPAVARDSSAERAAVGQSVVYPVVGRGNGVNITPAMQVPEPTDQTVDSPSMTIQKSRAFEFGFVGEEQLGLNNGPGYNMVQADMFAEALRGIVNEVETDLAIAAALGGSRAIGAAGVVPFASNTREVAQLGKVLADNGAPLGERNLVIGTTEGVNLRTLYGINTDRDWSNVPMQQQGVLITPHGLAIRETGQPQSHTAGTADSATTDDTGYAIGATEITLASAGTGTILAGDIVTFAGDDNQYQVASGDADVSNGGTITLHEPGLRQAISEDATAITVLKNTEVSPAESTYSIGGVAFYRRAIQLAMRAPALPEEGDVAVDSMMLQDPRSGLMFEVRVYVGYRKVRYEVGAAWGVKVVNPNHVAILLSE